MKQLPTLARAYVALVILAGGLFLARGLVHADFEKPLLLVALALLSSLAAALKVTLPLTASGSTMSVSYAVDFAALLLIGPEETMVVAAGSALSQCLLNRKEQNPLHRTLFSMASLIVTVQCAGLAMRLLGNPDPDDSLSQIAGPLTGAATVYFLVNTGLVAAAIALSTRDRIATVWHTNFLWSAPSYFVGAGTAAVAAWFVTNAGYWLAALMFAPLYLTFRTYKVYMGRIEDEQRHVQQTSDLHLATIEALARAIDAKDQPTQTHIRRVQHYAVRLARAVGLPPNAVQGVKTAALLHDIGKLAVPEHILSKPGPLTQEEFQKIRIHPQVGAEIIAAVPFPYPVAPLILSHHERWDGKGYPNGLAAHDIPIGARILTIVDYYDAVTTERPYHKAMSHESAVALLRHEAGRALDPRLVDTFIELLPAMMTEVEALPDEAARAAQQDNLPGETAVGLIPTNGRTAYESIALAHREIYALYEIAQTMGTSLGLTDTMALVSSKLTNIVPWSACALHLLQPDGQTVRCAFAVGVDVPKLLNRTVKLGAGLSGWVIQNRRTLVNADPHISFDAAGLPGTELQFRHRVPALLERREPDRLSRALPHRGKTLHGGPPPPARTRRRTGRPGHRQLDHLRPDAGRLAHRPAHVAAESPGPLRTSVAGAGARRAVEERGRPAGHGHRRLQDDQRHVRPPRRRPRAARRGAGTPDRAAALRPVRQVRGRRVHRPAVGVLARNGGRAAARAAGADRPDRGGGPARQAPSGSAPASARPSTRTTAVTTRRCSRTPTTGCTVTRLIAGAAARCSPSPKPLVTSSKSCRRPRSRSRNGSRFRLPRTSTNRRGIQERMAPAWMS